MWLSDWFERLFGKKTANQPVIVKATETECKGSSPTGGIPQCGLQLIKSFESCRLTVYHDVAGIATIGWGHVNGVRDGDTCTQEQADAWLASDCSDAWAAIQRSVKVPLTANQGGALLSWTYNLGVGTLEKSSLLAMLNSGNYVGIPAKIKQFIYASRPDGGRVMVQGLANRRKAEALLWCGGDWRP